MKFRHFIPSSMRRPHLYEQNLILFYLLAVGQCTPHTQNIFQPFSTQMNETENKGVTPFHELFGTATVAYGYSTLSDSVEQWFETSTQGEIEEELLITDHTTIAPNYREMYSPHLHHNNSQIARPYHGNGSTVFINKEFYKKSPESRENYRESKNDEAVTLPYYGNGIEKEWLTTKRSTIIPNLSEMYSPNLQYMYSPHPNNSQKARPYYGNGSAVFINKEFYKKLLQSPENNRKSKTNETVTLPYNGNGSYIFMDDEFFRTLTPRESEENWWKSSTVGVENEQADEFTLPGDRFKHGTWSQFSLSPEMFNRTKRNANGSHQDDSFDISFSFQHSLSEEAMEERLRTSTLSDSEEKLFRHYETKSWSVSGTDNSLQYDQDTSEYEKSTEPTGMISKYTPNVTIIEDIERGKWNITFPVNESDEKFFREFKSRVWDRAFSLSTNSKHNQTKGMTFSYNVNATPYQYPTANVTFTYTVPTRPSSLSDSQESWYAGLEERLKNTLSMDQFRPGDPTYWKSWPSTFWGKHFSYTTYPPYNPHNATTIRLPRELFPSSEEWQNYTLLKERYDNITFKDHFADTSNERAPNHYRDMQTELFFPTRGVSFPNIHLTPSEMTKARFDMKKHRLQLRGRGKRPKARKLPKSKKKSKLDKDDNASPERHKKKSGVFYNYWDKNREPQERSGRKSRNDRKRGDDREQDDSNPRGSRRSGDSDRDDRSDEKMV